MITNHSRNAILVLGVVIFVTAVAVLRQQTPATVGTSFEGVNAPQPVKLPRMIDLGADKCIPCKKMAPILAELKVEYAGRASIEFIDVWKSPAAGEPYGVRTIPTQIFFDRDGKEVWRHEGFLPKAEIVSKLEELGAR